MLLPRRAGRRALPAAAGLLARLLVEWKSVSEGGWPKEGTKGVAVESLRKSHPSGLSSLQPTWPKQLDHASQFGEVLG